VSKEDLAQGFRDQQARSTRASTDDDPPEPVATSEGLEELGQTLLLALSKAANWVMRQRHSRVDWRMTPGEAASIARPATRMLSRRMQIRSDLADATDVGRGADSLLSYVFRVLTGETLDELAADWDARMDAERAREDRPVELGAEPRRSPRHLRPQPEPEPESGFEERRDEVAVGAPVTGGPSKAYFAEGFEDV
jgi:hypothetical protein